MNKHLKDILITLGVVILTIALELGIGGKYVHDEIIFLMFVVAILVILIETKVIWYAIISSFIFVMSFNFFLTEPKYKFIVYDYNYFISFIVFFIVSLIVGSIVKKLQKQYLISKKNETSIHMMYDFSKRFLNSHEESTIYKIVIDYLYEYFKNDFYVVSKDYLVYGGLDISDLREAINYSLERNMRVGINEDKFNKINYKIFPIKSKMFSFGVLITNKEYLNQEELEFINNIINELVIVLDRERIIIQQETTKAQIENEKFKTMLLRSLSHDLKTPLTSIQGGSKFILDSFDLLSDTEKKELINDIYIESIDLTNFVINLLNMSHLDEKNIDKKYEYLEDILFNVLENVNKIPTNKEIILEKNEMVFINCNAKLLIQVFYNLIDNAIKHTKDFSKIYIKYKILEDKIEFYIIDNGGGIDPDKINLIFNDFYSLANKQDYSRQTGLGLSICKSIVKAHNGEITCFNNELGGATFKFFIPRKDLLEDEKDISN